MAEKLDPKKRGVASEDLAQVVREGNRMQAIASDYSSTNGQYLKTQIERLGLDKTAFSMVRRLERLPDDQRQAKMRAVIDYAFKLGFFDQVDAFDDVLVTLEEIASHIRGNVNRGPVDPLIADLTGN